MSFYNTTKLKGEELKQAINKADNQAEKVLLVYKNSSNNKLSASEVFNRLNINCPITSIRRAISGLKQAGKLLRLNEMRIGNYGKSEHYYKLI